MAEVNIQELQNKFQRGTASDSQQAIVDLFKLAGIKQDYVDSFVDANYNFLTKELTSYGFVVDNPFIQFLKYIQDKRANILEVFQDPENWSIIHNAVAEGVLDSKQINFTCEEIKQPKLLLNPYFWKVASVDKMWVLNLWEWCGEKQANSMIKHQGVRFLLNTCKNGVALNLKSIGADKTTKEFHLKFQSTKDLIEKESKKSIDNFDAIYSLRRVLIFTDDLVAYANEFKTLFSNMNNKTLNDNQYAYFESRYDTIRNKINDVNLVSDKLVNPQSMSASVRACSENVQVSDRDAATGQKQKQEGEAGDDTDSYNNKGQKYEESSMSVAEAEERLRRAGTDPDRLPFNSRAYQNPEKTGQAVTTILKARRR